ncbi:ATP-binding protein, partial [Lysinibacillus telephonicus]
MNETIEHLCKQLRLAHIAEGFEEIPFTTPDEFVYKLLLKERDGREQA